jgi:hypothetical protein
LVGDEKYISFLKNKAKNIDRIRFQPAVPMTELPKITNKYDIGLYVLAPTNFNNAMALPNKLFEYIQARLALVIGPSPEMARLVKKYDCGVVAKDFTSESLVESLSGINAEELRHYKIQSCLAAKELCLEANRDKFDKFVKKLLVP